ncbi:hypothetical protein [Mycobacteroides abscessus]|uniref:hypothetical protein n=1 Tax=Mycobacteroides abscessus TaxID=36809 RepID=UPI002104F792|nr:hypothetical protein [Mycobacteroides abscessus]
MNAPSFYTESREIDPTYGPVLVRRPTSNVRLVARGLAHKQASQDHPGGGTYTVCGQLITANTVGVQQTVTCPRCSWLYLGANAWEMTPDERQAFRKPSVTKPIR